MSFQLDISPEFYRKHATRFAEASPQFLDPHYSNSTHPSLRSDKDIIGRLRQLILPKGKRLDAGCGAGARDVFLYSKAGYDIHGVDVIEENLEVAAQLHPEIANRVSLADLSRPLEFENASFDFVICNCVIQHIPPKAVVETTLPELSRILKTGAITQFMFKVGTGITSIYDADYDTDRTFQLYSVEWIIDSLRKQALEVVAGNASELGGSVLFDDPKPMRTCLLYLRKAACDIEEISPPVP